MRTTMVTMVGCLVWSAAGGTASGQGPVDPGAVARTQPKTPPTLQAVLDDIAVKTTLRIVLDESLAGARVGIPMDGMPLDQVLVRVLAPYDVFYLHSADGKTPGTLKALWVYPRGVSSDLAPVPSSLWGSTKELERQLDDADPAVRMRAYETLIERQGDHGWPTLERALRDSDEDVRTTALSAANEAGIDVPTSEILRMLADDPSAAVRRLLLDAAEMRSDAEAVANAASLDADPEVRGVAAEILKRFLPASEDAGLEDPQQQLIRRATERKKPTGPPIW